MTDTKVTDTPKLRVVMGHNTYGKADVRLVKVFRDTERHELKDVWVNVAMEGDFLAAHTQGDNSGLLATDTVRNTVYALAGTGLTSSVEEFGKVLVQHFLSAGPRVGRVRVQLTEHLWQRAQSGEAGGQGHDHAFVRQMPKHTAWVEGDGQQVTVTSGIDELFILKTTQSGWEGFYREGYTTLPDTSDRILATVVTAKWEYLPVQGETDYDTVWQRVYDQLLSTFGDHYSPSMQNTLFRMGEAILTRCPELARIHFSFPNRHHIPYNLERFGLENTNTIFHADAEPYGLIEGWVERG